MNPNEMSLEECRAWLLERDGWKHHPADTELRECWERGLARVFRNPMPLSLDAIYAAMPEGWWFWINHCSIECKDGFVAEGVRKSDVRRVRVDLAPDRLTCEARLCVAMWMAEGKA